MNDHSVDQLRIGGKLVAQPQYIAEGFWSFVLRFQLFLFSQYSGQRSSYFDF
jgi:hypothetical protein